MYHSDRNRTVSNCALREDKVLEGDQLILGKKEDLF